MTTHSNRMWTQGHRGIFAIGSREFHQRNGNALVENRKFLLNNLKGKIATTFLSYIGL